MSTIRLKKKVRKKIGLCEESGYSGKHILESYIKYLKSCRFLTFLNRGFALHHYKNSDT